jgi:uncharacterized protein YbjQ (UPF0145 family)
VILTTTADIPGSKVVAVIGVVVGCVPYFGSTYSEGIKNLAGETVDDVPAVFENRRQEALNRLTKRAFERGADAVLCVRFDRRDISNSWKELCAFGTAVKLARDISER